MSVTPVIVGSGLGLVEGDGAVGWVGRDEAEGRAYRRDPGSRPETGTEAVVAQAVDGVPTKPIPCMLYALMSTVGAKFKLQGLQKGEFYLRKLSQLIDLKLVSPTAISDADAGHDDCEDPGSGEGVVVDDGDQGESEL